MNARRCCVALGVLWAGCGVESERSTDSFPITGASASIDPGDTEAQDDDGETAGGDDGRSDGDGDGDGGPRLDVGPSGTGTTGATTGCAKVDFLFVIDNSVSMDNEQDALIGAFPGFMEAIGATLTDANDIHVMVTDTDAEGRCWTGHCGHETCNDHACEDIFDACDRTRGAGVVHPAGEAATNAACELAGGHRYIVADEPDLVAAFQCIARVGVAGSGEERPMDAIVAALSPELGAPGECNDGFLRDDAILVITFISDDAKYEDSGTPTDWYDAVVAAKNGDPSAVVVLGMTPAWPGCRSDEGPPKGAHWQEFIELWGTHGLHGNVCTDAAAYVSFFELAVATIDATCDGFEPQG